MDGKTWKQIDLQQSEGTNVDSRDGSHVFCLKNCENQRMIPMSIYIYIFFFCFVIVYYSVFWWWWSFLVFIFGRCWHEHIAIAGSYTYTYILWMICFMYIIYFQHKEYINYSVWQELSVQMPLVKV